jgi:hypothetical protein
VSSNWFSDTSIRNQIVSKSGDARPYRLEPWPHLWRKPYAVRLTPEQPEVIAMAASRDGDGLFVVGRTSQGAMHFYDEREKRFVPY